MRTSLLLSLAAATSLAAPAAFAADLYAAPAPAVIPAPMAASPAFDWTGFYIGANGGYSFGDAEADDLDLGGDIEGALVGGQVGVNAQFNQFVIGAEADLQYSWLNGEDGPAEFDLNYFGTVRARAGYAFDRVLPYVTGGLAYGSGEVSVGDESAEETHIGYTVGGGLEYAFTDNLSAKGEYLYTDLGETSYEGADVDVDFHTVRVGLNYRF